MDGADVLVPIVLLLSVFGLVALRMLKPFGDRVLTLLERMYEVRQESTREHEEIERLRERVDLLAERQEFLEALLSEREEERIMAGGPEGPVS